MCEADGSKQNALAWLDALSGEQMAAVSPVLKALNGLLALPAGNATKGMAQDLGAPLEFEGPEPYVAIEKQLEQGLELTEFEALKATVEECLENVRSEKVRAERERRARAQAVEAEKARLAAGLSTDATTGLPTRRSFEQTVSAAIEDGKDSIVAVFIVERLAYINKRFGRLTGDEMLLSVAQYLAQELPDSSSLSRWSGPSFAAMFHVNAAARKVEMQVRAIANKKLFKSIDSGGRPVMIPISCTSTVVPLTPNVKADAVFAKMDDFISTYTNA